MDVSERQDKAVRLLREAREDREAFVETAAALAREAIERQYPTLRGYALMAGKTRQRLTLHLTFDFARTAGGVVIDSDATPPPVVDRLERKVTRRKPTPALPA